MRIMRFSLFALLGCLASVSVAQANVTGVTNNEIKIGSVFPFSGPASAFGNVGKGLIAYVRMLNDQGGINGRQINLIAYDDGYQPPKAVEQTRKLVEGDEVAMIFGQMGTPGNSATVKYLNAKKVPHLFISSGAAKFANFNDFPFTTTGLLSYAVEGRIYAKYVGKNFPNAKVAILYQNDDLGKDFLGAFKEGVSSGLAEKITALSYEVAEPTIDSQVVNLKTSGADVFLIAGSPKFTAQAIRKAYEINWRPQIMLNFVSSSIAATMVPAGVEKAIGAISGALLKDMVDERWANDQGILEYRAFFAKYLSGADILDGNYMYGVTQGMILEQLLKQCGSDLSRENLLKQARSIQPQQFPLAIPGIKVNTSANNSMAWTQLQLRRWNGKGWEPFGEIFSALD
ncbi:MAG: branched-chain amino acid ABC transporter substrate-binding protein [Proteobacteria bacterium SG_bin9]|nr:MAG: branched-chain amino acid ABC transporter substrate-binding protein [Proteobacteria bacterium SG_bin9]